MSNLSRVTRSIIITHAFPDLPLCAGVLKHRAPLARGWGHLPAKKENLFTMDVCLYGAILNFKIS